ncbi:hypothetical protein AB9K34_24010 [Sedimentitalea sp. XS_ASV28]
MVSEFAKARPTLNTPDIGYKVADNPAVLRRCLRLSDPPAQRRAVGWQVGLVIDGTSIGWVVSDMLFDQSVPHVAIQMTGGQEWRRSGRYVNASKTMMIENLACCSRRAN